jgi:hypothetical protein
MITTIIIHVYHIISGLIFGAHQYKKLNLKCLTIIINDNH